MRRNRESRVETRGSVLSWALAASATTSCVFPGNDVSGWALRYGKVRCFAQLTIATGTEVGGKLVVGQSDQ
jgi:hypothetical protein